MLCADVPLSSTDPLFYDVYTHVSELHLADVGIDIEWTDVDVFEGSEDPSYRDVELTKRLLPNAKTTRQAVKEWGKGLIVSA